MSDPLQDVQSQTWMLPADLEAAAISAQRRLHAEDVLECGQGVQMARLPEQERVPVKNVGPTFRHNIDRAPGRTAVLRGLVSRWDTENTNPLDRFYYMQFEKKF